PAPHRIGARHGSAPGGADLPDRCHPAGLPRRAGRDAERRMTPKPPDETPQVSSRPPDQRFREHGLTLILRLAALIRVGRAYQVGNQVFSAQMTGFVQALQLVLADSDEAVLVALDTDLYLNGFRIPIRPAN